ncbi:hypothetical protein Kpol_381p4 [Vanderwaltozyma polyspora DSM 70294]|uniref:Uncharacterized protein n=1 Tax=Vanderwaltozyma polyspora (strain ATCC 22028 / DSM 70294 / BCRC 21397 / CBS 2163 / NBRC 10782 / NRRL Y-8283 / UCD 57-17) TaxID=436907 RepID=A7TSQ2_VANPO|nr:uncharacterized protein Kpol_381p4 [Vanderwaltozyma polyspora DSM 70294]EDO14705.1 hypothetical protein Kpol_381p4 [Vanderwaltozyma polyspora DSM 70294]
MKRVPIILSANFYLGTTNKKAFPERVDKERFPALIKALEQFLFVINIFSKLSFVSHIKTPEVKVKVENIFESLSKYLYTIFSKGKTYYPYFQLLIRLSVLDWEGIQNTNCISTLSLNEFKENITCLKVWIVYACLNHSLVLDSYKEMVGLFVSEKLPKVNPNWFWILQIDNIITNELKANPEYDLRHLGKGKGLLNGKPFSKEYLNLLNEDIQLDMDQYLNKIKSNYLDLLTVKEVAELSLYAESINIYGICEHFNNCGSVTFKYVKYPSLIDAFEDKSLLKAIPDVRKSTNTVSDNKILDYIVQILDRLLFMMFIATDCYFGYKQLQGLQIMGDDRNVFIDSRDRTMYIGATTFLSVETFPRAKRLDKITSEYLVFSILVLTPLYKYHCKKLGYNLQYDMALFPHIQGYDHRCSSNFKKISELYPSKLYKAGRFTCDEIRIALEELEKEKSNE